MSDTQSGRPARIYRHRLPTRIWHWVNALTVFIMLMSGLMIFNAHPRLYWGQYGANFDHAWLQIGSMADRGFLRIGSLSIDTTGWLGLWTDGAGNVQRWAFPSWATIPSGYSLALGRRWHFAFALILVFGLIAFLATSLINRHVQRDLLPRPRELAPRHLWHDVRRHLQLRFDAEGGQTFNPLQKIAYAGVTLLLLPTLILSGLTMSPAMDAAWPWLLELFGGRQSARSVHFICAMLIVAFIAVHLLLVLLAGPVREIGSMITGWRREKVR